MHVPEILPSLRVDVVIDNLRDVAIVYGALGEKDKAFMWLEKEIVARASRPPLFSVNPVFDDLRDDPRFQELVRRVNAAKLD